MPLCCTSFFLNASVSILIITQHWIKSSKFILNLSWRSNTRVHKREKSGDLQNNRPFLHTIHIAENTMSHNFVHVNGPAQVSVPVQRVSTCVVHTVWASSQPKTRHAHRFRLVGNPNFTAEQTYCCGCIPQLTGCSQTLSEPGEAQSCQSSPIYLGRTLRTRKGEAMTLQTCASTSHW